MYGDKVDKLWKKIPQWWQDPLCIQELEVLELQSPPPTPGRSQEVRFEGDQHDHHDDHHDVDHDDDVHHLLILDSRDRPFEAGHAQVPLDHRPVKDAMQGGA